MAEQQRLLHQTHQKNPRGGEPALLCIWQHVRTHLPVCAGMFMGIHTHVPARREAHRPTGMRSG